MKPFFSHICWTSKAIRLVIKTTTVSALSGQQLLRQEQMAAEKMWLFFFAILEKLSRERFTVSNILWMFQEMKEIWLGKAEDGKAPSCQEARMRNVLHTSTNAGVHKLHTGFSICNKNPRGELFMFAATILCVWYQSSAQSEKPNSLWHSGDCSVENAINQSRLECWWITMA